MAKAPVFTSTEDRHLIFNASHQQLKCYKADGTLEWHVQARGKGAGDSSQTNGNTPPGLYLLDWAEHMSREKGYGPHRIHLNPVDLDKGKKRYGIYIHGGGSDLKDPFAPQQGWEKTHGCIRVQNQDLGLLVSKVHDVHSKKAQLWLTVQWW
ncbi:MAG TPA: L,D-transpeptidase [Terriglobia bacterium]|nr:L,D-transpeptidase [Terriglobia bacterium]